MSIHLRGTDAAASNCEPRQSLHCPALLLQGLKEEPVPKGGGRGRGRSAAAKTSSMRITPQRGSRLQQVGGADVSGPVASQ